jgi:glycosyltransferase involved in cell wall biosynthesis
MLRGLADQDVAVHAVVPVPWTERRGRPATVEPGYPVTFVPFWFVPRIAPLALASQLAWATRNTLPTAAAESDLLLGYWADPDGTVLARLATRLRLPRVQIVGGSDVLLVANAPRRGRRILATIASADQVLTVGEELRENLVRRGVATERITVIRRGVDRSRFRPGNQQSARRRLGLPVARKILLWVGRMVPVKGLDVLLEAMRHPDLVAQDPLLLLVGDGPERPRIERLATASLDPGAIRFVGGVPHAELATWYQAADLMVLPSHSEGVPNVLLEAVACGTGFVASDVGGVRNLTATPDLDLVPPGDAMRLANALTARIGHPEPVLIEVIDSREAARNLASLLRQVVSGR